MPQPCSPLLFSFVAITAGLGDNCHTLLVAGSMAQMEALYRAPFADFKAHELRPGSSELLSQGFYIEEREGFAPSKCPLDFFVQHPQLGCRGFYGVGSEELSDEDLCLLTQALVERVAERGAVVLGSTPSPWVYEPRAGAMTWRFVETYFFGLAPGVGLAPWAQSLTERALLSQAQLPSPFASPQALSL